MRQALLEVIGSIITELSNASTDNDNSKTAQKQISGLFDLLIERTFDISSYVSTKLLQVLAKRCDLKPKFSKQRSAITGVAIAALADKGATAAAFLVKLLETHPYRTHGCVLHLDEPQGRLGRGRRKNGRRRRRRERHTQENAQEEKETSKAQTPKSQLNVAAVTEEQAVLAGLEVQELQLMKLRKKYYVEGLAFIRQIECAMEPMGLLLGSKNKPEVSEAIEFFKVAHDYEFESAKVRVTEMLHLIWAKDDNSSGPAEEGKEGKGVRKKLLDCYLGLYPEAIEGL